MVASVAVWVMLRIFSWVRVQPSGLVIGFPRRTVGWDEIDTVRLESGPSIAKLNLYGPMAELRSGEKLLLRELFSPSMTRRLPRSLPVRHVAIIAGYLAHYGHS